MEWHYRSPSLAVRKLCVGPLENNVYVVTCPATGRAAVIDAADEAGRILEATTGLTVEAILTTHGHRDHIRAARSVRDALGAQLRIHEADAGALPVPPDSVLEDGEVIPLGRTTLRAVHTPGHTPGSMCFVSGDGVVFTGDTLFPGGPGATPGPEAFATVMESLRSRLFPLADGTLVCPGHGLDTTIGAERPSLEAWRRRGW